MKSSIFLLFAVMVVFVASPISGRPKPNPCLATIRSLQDRLQKRINDIRNNVGRRSTRDFEDGKKAQSAADFKELDDEVKKLDTEVDQAQKELDTAKANVAAGGANPSQALKDAQTKAEENLRLKTALRDAKMKDRDLVKGRAGL